VGEFTQSQLSINDWDTDLNSFHSHDSAPHYRDPVAYNEMLQIINGYLRRSSNLGQNKNEDDKEYYLLGYNV
jgi:hypothetical protein